MANLSLFESIRGALAPVANALNEEGASAYQRTPEGALALYAATGCLNATFYATDEAQLATVLMLAAQVSPGFVARTAVYARETMHIKDMPALLLATLSTRDPDLFTAAFPRVVTNGRMLRNVVQILRSGRVGRKSLGSRPKRLVQQWIAHASTDALINAAIGQQPSLADVIRMVHPKPADAEREALYAWIVGRPYREEALPPKLRAFEAFKRDPSGELPDLPFQYYTSLPLGRQHWTTLARKASWQTLRMGLNTFARNGVWDDAGVVAEIAARLRDPEAISGARVFPYQLLMAFQAAAVSMPVAITEALQDAMEIATRRVPTIAGNVAVAVDVSGSMSSPVTGFRRGSTSAARCVDVAALVAATLLRTNPQARVLPFDTEVRDVQLNPRDSVMTQARQLAALCGGGTSVSAPIASLNRDRAMVDLVVLVSDNESWRDTRGGATQTMREWGRLKARCPQARLVCIDLQPCATSQTVEREDVLHVGGFNDAVFELLAGQAAGNASPARWVERIASIEL
ncbi:RNA-binding protein [Pseudoxanthomonas gei]|uniref:RNA-binding protein n=1 Tax=Pseudoxanthomonas gei TaxID=1383030 RepID=A0ABX0A9I9_9GAMM|nr:RNA-binding protein [Pseudoxanthomonas gei]NDK38192.1 RNA-binding protein [Pseudoxanthomonas gei]